MRCRICSCDWSKSVALTVCKPLLDSVSQAQYSSEIWHLLTDPCYVPKGVLAFLVVSFQKLRKPCHLPHLQVTLPIASYAKSDMKLRCLAKLFFCPHFQTPAIHPSWMDGFGGMSGSQSFNQGFCPNFDFQKDSMFHLPDTLPGHCIFFFFVCVFYHGFGANIYVACNKGYFSLN